MTIPNPPYKGTCLCGAVTVNVTARPLLTLACHCRGCQKFTASAYSLTTMFPADSFQCTGALIKGGLRSEAKKHYFCASCLNFIYSRINGAEHRVNLRTSVLNDASQFAPFVEVMTEKKIPWAKVPATHSFPRYPESTEHLQALMDDYRKS